MPPAPESAPASAGPESVDRPTPNALAIALGAVPLEVPDHAGAPVRVTVRLLKVAEFTRFFELLDQEEALVAFACVFAPPATLECLPPNSVLDLAEKVFDLNFTTAQRWAERRARLSGAAESFRQRVAPPSA